MKIIRTFAAAFICATALALAAPHLSAQQQPAPRGGRTADRPVPPPPAGYERPEGTTADPDVAREIEQVRESRYYRPVVRVGQGFQLRQGETARHVVTVFGDTAIDGNVEQDVVVILGSARIGATAAIRGSLVVVGGTATISEGAAINGDLVVTAGSLSAPLDFSPGGDQVVIGTPMLGDALRSVAPWFTRGLLWGRLIVPDLWWMWVVVGIAFFISLLVNTLFDGPVHGCAESIVQRPLSSFLVGLLVAVLFVPVIAILAATVIGLIVVPFVVFALIFAAIVGRVGVDRAIGYGILRPETHEGRLQALLAFVIGFAVLVFVYMVPLIGLLTWALTGVLGLGAAAATFRAGLRREQPVRAVAASPAPAVAATAPIVEPGPYAEPVPAVTAAIPVAPIEVAAPVATPTAAPVMDPGALATYPRATFLDRVAAFVIDCILVAIAYQILDFWTRDGMYALMLFAYHVAFWAWKGTTLGGIICALRVVKMDGQELRFADTLVRGLTAIFSLAALGIGCFWMLYDPQQQMWHDKIAGTIVVKVPRHMAIP